MTDRPRNVTDLYLAPVALQLDQRLAELSTMSPAQVRDFIAVRTEHTPFTPDERRTWLLSAITDTLDLHGWSASWCSRGLRLTHGPNALVLGLHPTLSGYLELENSGD